MTFKALPGAAISLLGILLAASPARATTINTFSESSCPGYYHDAGDTSATACVITGGPYGIISGNIGGVLGTVLVDPLDTVDMYKFHWMVAGIFRVDVTDGSGPFNTFIKLFQSDGVTQVSMQTLGTGSERSVNSLAVGFYYLYISATVDPPISSAIFNLNPDGGINIDVPNPIGVAANVPEPGTMILLGTGLALLARRRTARTHSR